MCQECVEISKMDIPAKWYRINGAIKGDAPDNVTFYEEYFQRLVIDTVLLKIKIKYYDL